jgi:ubiquinone/menaquinone biosynthesis C-methylase UbiE
VEIARELLSDCDNAEALRGDCRLLPYEANSFDRVYGGDVIEHMSYQDGVSMLLEAYRVLKPGGLLLIHTSPNSWFSCFTYPILRPIIWFIKPQLAKSLSEHYEVAAAVHVHEYSYFTLIKAAKQAKLEGIEVWIDPDILRSGNDTFTKDLGMIGKLATVFQKLKIFKLLFGNDLYLKATKPEI